MILLKILLHKLIMICYSHFKNINRLSIYDINNNNYMWAELDQYMDDSISNSSEFVEYFSCDGYKCCFKNKLHIPFYHYRPYDDNDSIDLCLNCYNNIDEILKLEVIDNNSIELYFPCIFCYNKLEKAPSCFLCEHKDIIINVCVECNNKYNFYTKIKEKFVLITEHFMDRDNFISQFINFSPVKERKIPEELKCMITHKKIKKWINCIHDITYISQNFGSFGPIKQWTLFTELYQFPKIKGKNIGLLVDCSMNTNGRIAILLADINGWSSVYMIYSSFEDFKRDYNIWFNTQSEEYQSDIDHENIYKQFIYHLMKNSIMI